MHSSLYSVLTLNKENQSFSYMLATFKKHILCNFYTDIQTLVLCYWLQLTSTTYKFMFQPQIICYIICSIHFIAIQLKIVHPHSSALKLVLSTSQKCQKSETSAFYLALQKINTQNDFMWQQLLKCRISTQILYQTLQPYPILTVSAALL